MIDIELPNPSERICLSDYKNTKNESGFYIMKNTNGEVIYIGEAEDVRKRLGKHFSGKSSTTKLFKHLFTYAEIFYCSPTKRKIYEIYAINHFDPVGNVSENFNLSKAELKSRREEWIRNNRNN